MSDFVGKRIADVAVTTDGRRATDARATSLVQTRVGEPLNMAAVRESLTHLFSLGTFEDIQVVAAPRGDGVALTFDLRALRPVEEIGFRGTDVEGLDEGRLRRLIAERFGASPRANRVSDAAQAIQDDLRQTGFLSAVVTGGAATRPNETHSVMVFEVAPGPRARIGTLVLTGDAGVPEAEVFSRLGLAPGRASSASRCRHASSVLCSSGATTGSSSARASVAVDPADEGRLVNLTINASQGPAIRVVFEGDAIPRSQQTELAPVAPRRLGGSGPARGFGHPHPRLSPRPGLPRCTGVVCARGE